MGENRGAILLGNALAFGIIAVCIVGLRIGYRTYRKWADASDWCIAIALVSSIVQDSLNAACITQWGYGQHRAALSPIVAHSAVPLKLYWLNQVFFKVTTLFTKLSLCIVYLKLFQRATNPLIRRTRIVNYVTAFLIVGYYGAAFLVSIFQCTPISKVWRPKEAGTCINLTDFCFSTAAINTFTSVLVIATPLPALFQIRRRGSEISQIVFLILLGLIHTGCTIARLVLMIYPDPVAKKDPQWATLPANTLSIVEMNVGIIAASLVVMRPCFQAIYSIIVGPRPPSSFTSRMNSYDTRSDKLMKSNRVKEITRTIKIETSTQSMSTEGILQSE